MQGLSQGLNYFYQFWKKFTSAILKLYKYNKNEVYDL